MGKGYNELMKLHLVKSYRLPSLFYGCEVWSLSTSDVHKINVVWNNGFRRIFGGFWRGSVKLLQFYNKTLPATLIVDERKLLFWKKCFCLQM